MAAGSRDEPSATAKGDVGGDVDLAQQAVEVSQRQRLIRASANLAALCAALSAAGRPGEALVPGLEAIAVERRLPPRPLLPRP